MTAKNLGESGENPLVPNAKLRAMYTKMVEARVLDEATIKRLKARGRRRITTVRGQEAIRISTTTDLTENDLISDSKPSAAMGLLLGGDPASLLRGLTQKKEDPEKVLTESGVSRFLRSVDDEEDRLRYAAGAALALKSQGHRGILVAYAYKDEVSRATWRRVLASVAKLELPILFVVLSPKSVRKGGVERAELCNLARTAGVPGIPVDACDAVAVYRVVQESLGRMRGGDGPVLIESVSWRVEGARGGTDR
jgi:TPP-dependent pyruvate/acetoin dehydrogenase alpha subunit